MEESLISLSEKYCTDKRPEEHNYVQYYDFYFKRARNLSIDLVEIGILEHPDKLNRPFGAASLRMWADYFTYANIFGIDIIDLRHLQQERIKIFIGDQSVPQNIRNIFVTNHLKPNIIIDDGSHIISHQQITFGESFKYLAPGGFYVIEDIVQYQLSENQNLISVMPASFHGYAGTIPLAYTSMAHQFEHLKFTTLSVFLKYCSAGIIDSPFISKEDSRYIEQNISFCNIHKSNIFNLSIVFIRKK